MAEQNALTAYPKDTSFKFVWSGTDAVYTSSDKKTVLRCTFMDSLNGVDDSAEPYVAVTFTCESEVRLILKQLKERGQSFLLLTDKKWNIIGSIAVEVEKKSY